MSATKQSHEQRLRDQLDEYASEQEFSVNHDQWIYLENDYGEGKLMLNYYEHDEQKSKYIPDKHPDPLSGSEHEAYYINDLVLTDTIGQIHIFFKSE